MVLFIDVHPKRGLLLNNWKGKRISTSTGIGLGVAIGAVIGVLTDNVGLWIALGVAIGAGVGAAKGGSSTKQKNDSED